MFVLAGKEYVCLVFGAIPGRRFGNTGWLCRTVGVGLLTGNAGGIGTGAGPGTTGYAVNTGLDTGPGQGTIAAIQTFLVGGIQRDNNFFAQVQFGVQVFLFHDGKFEEVKR